MTDASALLIIDCQRDFCPGGALAVAGGHEILPLIHDLQSRFAHVIATQDWHPADHSSFASQHEGKAPFETMEMAYGTQVLWPDHCVQGTLGAEFHEALDVTRVELILRKGFRRGVDSYSAFFENDKRTRTGLEGYLRERGIGTLYLCGLATDYCVAFSALDARRLGFETHVVLDACRGIDLNGSVAVMLDAMRQAGVAIVTSEALPRR
ncbi:MAG: bifunctional nicotinamidase/pyrazinamidase [Aestuariivirgaceae bacterium]|nr:bifunctional nicotinamidase/pyrazinamidase [Aestuariivirgaceae bacterium]